MDFLTYNQDPSWDKSISVDKQVSALWAGGKFGAGASAFASVGGIELMLGDEEFRKFIQKGKFILIVGAESITNPSAVRKLREYNKKYKNLSIKAYIGEGKGIFHPKYNWVQSVKPNEGKVWTSSAKWLNYYFSICPPKHSYEAVCMDYADALDFLRGRQIAAIYADPPYTRYHYSRYYHVLETMCLHDNPDVSTTFPNGKGGISRAVYRKDRHQSPFCIKSKAEGAFRTLFAKASRLDVPLVLSYSPYDSSKSAVTPRLQTIEQLIDLAKEYYDHISIASPGHFVHSKLNSTENNFDDASHEAERLIICRKDGIDDSH